MVKFWISWISGNYASEGCTAPPFQLWISGQRERPLFGLTQEQYNHMTSLKLDDAATDDYIDRYGKDDCVMCALVEATSEEEIWKTVKTYFPDCKMRFISAVDDDYIPGDRFVNFQNKTSLYFTSSVL